MGEWYAEIMHVETENDWLNLVDRIQCQNYLNPRPYPRTHLHHHLCCDR
jgi:hypothetical protein